MWSKKRLSLPEFARIRSKPSNSDGFWIIPGQVQWSGVFVSCPSGGLCGECECGVLLEGGLGCESGSGEDARAGVASAFGPFVGLFGQDGSDEADDGLAVGEDAHGIGAAPDLAVEALVGVVGPDLGPHPGGEGCAREDVCPGLIEVITHGGELVVDVVQEPVVLSVDRCGVGLAAPSAASL